jgi:hypothetical protein
MHLDALGNDWSHRCAGFRVENERGTVHGKMEIFKSYVNHGPGETIEREQTIRTAGDIHDGETLLSHPPDKLNEFGYLGPIGKIEEILRRSGSLESGIARNVLISFQSHGWYEL